MIEEPQILHATTVAVEGAAVLIIGASGAGKSALAIQMLALGAELVADDRTKVTREGPQVIAQVPTTIAGKIEARGIGIIDVPTTGPTPVVLVVDMDQLERQRLPEDHVHTLLGLRHPCLHKVETAYFPSAVLLYMKAL